MPIECSLRARIEGRKDTYMVPVSKGALSRFEEEEKICSNLFTLHRRYVYLSSLLSSLPSPEQRTLRLSTSDHMLHKK